MAKKKKVDVSDFLNSNAGAKPKAGKKNGIPELTESGELADKIVEANKLMKDSKAAHAALEAQLLEIVAPKYESHATSGTFTKSFNVIGEETPGVQVTYKDKFSAISIDEKDTIEADLEDAEQEFDTYFEERRVLTLVDTSDETVQLLIEKLGPEKFKQIFEIKLSLAAKPDMDRKQFSLPEKVKWLVSQDKASVKVRK